MSSSMIPRSPISPVCFTPFHDEMAGLSMAAVTGPASGTWGTANLAHFYPVYLLEPYTVAKAFWCNGATVGTDSIDLGIYQMTSQSTGRMDLVRSTGAVLSAGTVSVVQEVSAWKVARVNLTSGSDSTDSTTYTTASVTLKRGRCYLLSVENSAASAAVLSTVANGPTFASRSSVQYNGTANRTSIWSAVPTVDYTGTLVITFGATQTGACWSLDEMSGVDTTTNDGIVQQATGTGSSVTPLATLSAFANANNATFGAHGHAAATATTPGTGFTELSDVTAATPAQALETEWRVDNATAVSATITSAAWGSCAVEIKADASAFVIPPSLPGNPMVYMALTMSGTTATILRYAAALPNARGAGYLSQASTFPLPSSLLVTGIAPGKVPLAGFSLRSLIA